MRTLKQALDRLENDRVPGIECQAGANRIDATVAGIGRGAGNCPMELLIGFLRNPNYKLRPFLELLQDYFVALRTIHYV